MEDNNRYEDIPEKKSVGARFGSYLKKVFGGFIDSFKYNNMKLPALLIAVPGLIIGFFLVFHARTINQMAFEYEAQVLVGRREYQTVTVHFSGMPFDATGIAIFLLMLFGILNVFVSLNVSGKKNKGSVIWATVFTVILIGITVYYVYSILYYKKITTDGESLYQEFDLINSKNEEVHVVFDEHIVKQNAQIAIFNENYMTSMVSIIVCDVLSVIGVILGFIHYDRTYEKADR